MTCSSCVRLVQNVLNLLPQVELGNVSLGRAFLEFDDKVISEQLIINQITDAGFVILMNPKLQIVEDVKTACIELIQFSNNASSSIIKNSEYLSERLDMSYANITKIFSEIEEITLERYILLLKIEKIKELLFYDELSLSEIAYMMNYSSVQYLSTLFKKVTGYTVTEFKQIPIGKRIRRDMLNDVNRQQKLDSKLVNLSHTFSNEG